MECDLSVSHEFECGFAFHIFQLIRLADLFWAELSPASWLGCCPAPLWWNAEGERFRFTLMLKLMGIVARLVLVGRGSANSFCLPIPIRKDARRMSKNRKAVSKKFAAYPRLNPLGVGKNISAADLIDECFLAYNGGRLREAAQLLVEKMLPNNGCIGMSLTGALTPAGLGKSCLIPLMKAGFVDWVVSTGANLYHDLHYGLNMQLYSGSPFLNDVDLHRDGVIRIYDVLFDYNVLLDTDAFVREVIQGPEFQRPMGTDEFHFLLGKYVQARRGKYLIVTHSNTKTKKATLERMAKKLGAAISSTCPSG